MSDALLDPILQSPLFPTLVDRLAEVRVAEADARRKFLQDLTPEMKAEFILGEVCMHSPARAKHLAATRNLLYLLHCHCRDRDLGCVFSEKCLVSLTRNDFEPDIVWFSPEKAADFTDDQMRFPAPDFVVEVLSETTEDRDRGIKFEDYALHGVREYWIVDTVAESVEQYLLVESGSGADSEGRFRLHEKLVHGVVRSEVVEGFEIPLEAIFRG